MKILLAESEPSTHGTKRTRRALNLGSAGAGNSPIEFIDNQNVRQAQDRSRNVSWWLPPPRRLLEKGDWHHLKIPAMLVHDERFRIVRCVPKLFSGWPIRTRFYFCLQTINRGFTLAVCGDPASRARKRSGQLDAKDLLHSGSGDRAQNSVNSPDTKSSGRIVPRGNRLSL